MDWQRRIELEGCLNLRDIGGYAAGEGHVRRGVILRSDSLSALPAASKLTLLERGVRAIIDIRGPWETIEGLHTFADARDVTYHNIPLFGDGMGPEPPKGPEETPESYWANTYSLWLDRCGPHYAKIAAAVAECGEHEQVPLVMHCAAGKDRTGSVVALLLDLAGVQPEVIAEDYALSGVYLQPALDDLRKQMGLARNDTSLLPIAIECPPEAVIGMLAHLHSVYGGAESYLRSEGLSVEQIEALKKMLIEY